MVHNKKDYNTKPDMINVGYLFKKDKNSIKSKIANDNKLFLELTGNVFPLHMGQTKWKFTKISGDIVKKDTKMKKFNPKGWDMNEDADNYGN